MKLTYKDRIAFYFMITTAVIVTVLMVLIYSIVWSTVYSHMDNDLDFETRKHLREIKVEDGLIKFFNRYEWLEREHENVEVNPVFIQITDAEGNFYDKSPNLKQEHLYYHPEQKEFRHFNAYLSGKSIRQVQVPVYDENDNLSGFMILALVLEDSQMVLRNLKKVMLVAFPVVMICLFLVVRYMAGRSILPVQHITQTAREITRENLSERITLPANRDELHTLAVTINDLLSRMEQAIKREKQFTSDASHQLRTPLAVIKGTLEVLLRKPREVEEYQEKIRYSIREIDRMNKMVEQLLFLARFEHERTRLEYKKVMLHEAIDQVLQRLQSSIKTKMMGVKLDIQDVLEAHVDPYVLDVIIENIISNAIKYSPEFTNLEIRLGQQHGEGYCEFKDHGIGIKEEELPLIFDRFYRADTLQKSPVEGSGLGLAIVSRMCALLQIRLKVESQNQDGTKVTLRFPSQLLIQSD